MRKKSGLIVEELPGGGYLVLDEAAGLSHALKPDAAKVWASLEDARSEEEIAERTGLDAGVVHTAVAELRTAGLLEGGDGGTSRRELLTKAAVVAGAAAALTLIDTIATPSPAAAQSGTDNEDDTPADGASSHRS